LADPNQPFSKLSCKTAVLKAIKQNSLCQGYQAKQPLSRLSSKTAFLKAIRQNSLSQGYQANSLSQD